MWSIKSISYPFSLINYWYTVVSIYSHYYADISPYTSTHRILTSRVVYIRSITCRFVMYNIREYFIKLISTFVLKTQFGVIIQSLCWDFFLCLRSIVKWICTGNYIRSVKRVLRKAGRNTGLLHITQQQTGT